ncbi:MAG: SUMF1/EgtB/PvdO family nonheme iron enzyme [Nitrospirae bacterium]|nr:SUMF1/EgtB/PvdO family nonheme iron enzyme [Nitrospirota bacterium]
MKKDALYYGIISAGAAFVLMIGTFIYFAVSDFVGRGKRQSAVKEMQAEALNPDRFKEFKTIKGVDDALMVWIPEWTFAMGSPPVEGDPDESPQRTIYLSGYYIDLKEVTHGQFQNYLKGIGSKSKLVIPVFMDNPALLTSKELPANGVSWDGANDYCKWAGKRLPTEAEWEKAARGERGLKWPWGNEGLEGRANLQGEEDHFKYTAPPGKFEAGRSPYGLYDMAGNVGEWVADWYDGSYYLSGPFKNPKGPESGKFRVYRGGSWEDVLTNVRTAKRFQAAPHQTSAVIGFRCAKDVAGS